jgi:hypothetical protein
VSDSSEDEISDIDIDTFTLVTLNPEDLASVSVAKPTCRPAVTSASSPTCQCDDYQPITVAKQQPTMVDEQQSALMDQVSAAAKKDVGYVFRKDPGRRRVAAANAGCYDNSANTNSSESSVHTSTTDTALPTNSLANASAIDVASVREPTKSVAPTSSSVAQRPISSVVKLAASIVADLPAASSRGKKDSAECG